VTDHRPTVTAVTRYRESRCCWQVKIDSWYVYSSIFVLR